MQKRQRKYTTSYSNTSQREAEIRIGIRIMNLIREEKDPFDIVGSIRKVPQNVIEKVYERLIDSIKAEGFPSGGIEPFKEVVINDFVGDVMRVIISDYKTETEKDNIILTREKEIVSTDEENGGNMEFVLIDTVSISKDRYLIVVEVKKDIMEKGLVQCLLSLKDMYDINDDKKNVYGFVTTGVDWKLIKYDGSFNISDKMTLLFSGMSERKEEWLRKYSQVIDVVYRTVVDTSE
jgi:hypothetical protein